MGFCIRRYEAGAFDNGVPFFSRILMQNDTMVVAGTYRITVCASGDEADPGRATLLVKHDKRKKTLVVTDQDVSSLSGNRRPSA